MNEFEDKINAWIQNFLIPHLASIFHKTCNLTNIKYTIARPKNSFFLSELFFVNIQFPDQLKGVVLKLFPQDPDKLSLQNYDQLFNNEILFYEKLANNINANYPEYYLGNKDVLLSKIIVLENVSFRGYCNSAEKINVSLEYVKAGLKSIARFHGSTYAMKEQSFYTFSEIAKNIIDLRFDKQSISSKFFIDNLELRTNRVIKALNNRNYDSKFVEKIEYLFQDSYNNIILKCVKPTEPLATIIHGDPTINNLMFKKSGDNSCGSLEAMLLDFGLILYSSPILDIVTFIYTCCSRNDIKHHFEELFKIYYNSLIEFLKEKGINDSEKYSYDAFLSEYRRCAIFGYMINVFFLPLMTEYSRNSDILSLHVSILNEIALHGGGDVMSNLLVDMLIDMRENGLLDYYVNND